MYVLCRFAARAANAGISLGGFLGGRCVKDCFASLAMTSRLWVTISHCEAGCQSNLTMSYYVYLLANKTCTVI